MLKELLNLENIMSQPRTEWAPIMENLFVGAKVLASADTEDDTNTLGYVYEFDDQSIAIVSDHFGTTKTFASCEGVSDTQLKLNCIDLANNAKTFENVKDAFLYLRKAKQDNATYFELKDIIDPLIKNLYKNKVINPSEILGAK